jgi:phospholipase C
VTFADGQTAPNVVQPDIVPAVVHSPKAQRWGIHNEWNQIGGCKQSPHYCVTHSDPANIPNLIRLANQYVVSDRTFAAGKAASFVAHVSLGGGTYDGYQGGLPERSKTGVKPGEGWGCSSNLDALWGPPTERSWEPTCIPDKQGNGPYRESRVPYTRTIMQRMEQAGLSWHIYEGDDNDKPIIGPFSICTYFAWCWLHRFKPAYDSSRADYYADAAAGTLPNLSVMLPTGNSPLHGGFSQHNGNSMRLGDNYIGDIVQAAMRGPDWDSTAIFITYDDCGCFYDHVKPPDGLGLRNPMVIVSPWVRHQGTDSHVAVQPYSMLAFAVHTFGLKRLTPAVTHAYDYADAFDFTQQPLPGVRMSTEWRPPPAELRRLIRLAPLIDKDPT